MEISDYVSSIFVDMPVKTKSKVLLYQLLQKGIISDFVISCNRMVPYCDSTDVAIRWELFYLFVSFQIVPWIERLN